MAEPVKNGDAWIKTRWRPMMAVGYFVTCLFDFVVAPIMVTVYSFLSQSDTLAVWAPLTIQGGGLYHIAMGAVIGVAAWSRGQEKMAGKA